MGYLKEMWRQNESMFLLFVLMVIAHMCTGCSASVQRVCTSGDESDAVEYAVEYWAQRSHAIMVANDGCTIRTRLADNRVGGYTWGETQYGEHYFATDLEPSHTIQSELRLRAEWWPLMSECKQRLIVVHELGHTWEREHTHEGVMAEWLPESDDECEKLLKGKML